MYTHRREQNQNKLIKRGQKVTSANHLQNTPVWQKKENDATFCMEIEVAVSALNCYLGVAADRKSSTGKEPHDSTGIVDPSMVSKLFDLLELNHPDPKSCRRQNTPQLKCKWSSNKEDHDILYTRFTCNNDEATDLGEQTFLGGVPGAITKEKPMSFTHDQISFSEEGNILWFKFNPPDIWENLSEVYWIVHHRNCKPESKKMEKGCYRHQKNNPDLQRFLRFFT